MYQGIDAFSVDWRDFGRELAALAIQESAFSLSRMDKL